jgi:hypothetical protein
MAETIHEEISNYEESTSNLISKGRKLLVDKFNVGDWKKVKAVKDYLTSDDIDDNYLALYPFEESMILYWIEDYDELILHIQNTHLLHRKYFSKKILPNRDWLSNLLLIESRNEKDKLELNILESNLNEENKDFLMLYLSYLLEDENYTGTTQNDVNNMSDQFLTTYPESIFATLISTDIRQKYIRADWGFGIELFSGFGILTGDVTNYFEDNIGIGWSFDIAYQAYELYLRNYFGFTNNKVDIPIPSGIYKKNTTSQITGFEASLGYDVFENKKFKLTPFIGIAGIGISKYSNDDDESPLEKEIRTEFSKTLALGFNLDYKIAPPYITKEAGDLITDYIFIRFRYTYNRSDMSNRYYDANGNMHYFTIGVGSFRRDLKRDL